MKNTNLSNLFLFCAGLLLVLITVGCGENETQIALNNALEKVEMLAVKVEQIPMDSVASVRDRLSGAKDDIRWLGLDSNVVFVRADAKAVEKLSEASRFLKDAPSRYNGLINEIGRCRTQLNGLREVLESGANLDSLGDTINDEYINRNARFEVEAVTKLEAVVVETLRLIRLGLETDSAGWGTIDSLIVAKRGEWARGVSVNETEIGL